MEESYKNRDEIKERRVKDEPDEELKKWLTAYLCSRTLAQYSTDRYAGGLYCRVRNGTGCDPAAMAVIPKQAIHNRYLILSINGLDKS